MMPSGYDFRPGACTPRDAVAVRSSADSGPADKFGPAFKKIGLARKSEDSVGKSQVGVEFNARSRESAFG